MKRLFLSCGGLSHPLQTRLEELWLLKSRQWLLRRSSCGKTLQLFLMKILLIEWALFLLWLTPVYLNTRLKVKHTHQRIVFDLSCKLSVQRKFQVRQWSWTILKMRKNTTIILMYTPVILNGSLLATKKPDLLEMVFQNLNHY